MVCQKAQQWEAQLVQSLAVLSGPGRELLMGCLSEMRMAAMLDLDWELHWVHWWDRWTGHQWATLWAKQWEHHWP